MEKEGIAFENSHQTQNALDVFVDLTDRVMLILERNDRRSFNVKELNDMLSFYSQQVRRLKVCDVVLWLCGGRE
jgi:hypothetical protein